MDPKHQAILEAVLKDHDAEEHLNKACGRIQVGNYLIVKDKQSGAFSIHDIDQSKLPEEFRLRSYDTGDTLLMDFNWRCGNVAAFVSNLISEEEVEEMLEVLAIRRLAAVAVSEFFRTLDLPPGLLINPETEEVAFGTPHGDKQRITPQMIHKAQKAWLKPKWFRMLTELKGNDTLPGWVNEAMGWPQPPQNLH